MEVRTDTMTPKSFLCLGPLRLDPVSREAAKICRLLPGPVSDLGQDIVGGTPRAERSLQAFIIPSPKVAAVSEYPQTGSTSSRCDRAGPGCYSLWGR